MTQAPMNYAGLLALYQAEERAKHNAVIADALRQRAAASQQPAEVSTEDTKSEQLDQDEAA